MPRVNKNAISLLLLITSAGLLGCAHRPGPRSSYQIYYQNRLTGIKVPTHEEIASVKDSLLEVFDRPAQEIWNACAGLAAQSRGVLAAAADTSGGHRLLLISGETLEHKRGREAFVDRWMAISVQPIAENSTEVRIAFVSPQTMRASPFSTDMLSKEFKGDRQQSISRRPAEAFMLALEKTFSEDEYLARFVDVSRPSTRGAPRSIEVKYTEKGEAVAQRRANYNSAGIRREWFALNVPRLEERIAGIVDDIARAASPPDRKANVFILAALVPNVHIESNGDLFITTGALDKLQNIDELAGILSHEIAHLYMHHGSTRAGAFRRAGASRNAIIFTLILGGAAIDFLSNIPDSASPEDTLLSTEEVLAGVAVTLGTYYLSGQLGTGIGKGVGSFTIHRFTRKQELEADEYGAELLWAAGYDYRGLLNLLRRDGDSKLFETKSDKGPKP